MEIPGYMAIVFIGLVLGSIGAGGSMLAIPVLVHLFAMDMETASAYSLFLVGVTSLTGAALKQREQIVSAQAILLFGTPSVAGIFISRNWIVACIPQVVWKSNHHVFTKHDLLLTLFLLLMFVSSLTMLLNKKSHVRDLHSSKFCLLLPLGFVTGILAGLAGIGGGFLILPALVIFAALPLSTAVGTSLFIIALNSLIGFCGDVLNQTINWYFLFEVTALAMLGLFLGSWLHKSLGKSICTTQSFAWLMLAISIFLLICALV